MIVCHCRVVNDREIRDAIDAGARTLGRVCRATGAGQECGGCVQGVRALLQAYDRVDTIAHVRERAARLASLRPALEPAHAAA